MSESRLDTAGGSNAQSGSPLWLWQWCHRFENMAKSRCHLSAGYLSSGGCRPCFDVSRMPRGDGNETGNALGGRKPPSFTGWASFARCTHALFNR
jgi:hypothetical protein